MSLVLPVRDLGSVGYVMGREGSKLKSEQAAVDGEEPDSQLSPISHSGDSVALSTNRLEGGMYQRMG
jgi:hypothetical protein